MKEKVLNFIKEKNLINENDKVLVALSGGPDSVCLLHILCELKEKLKIDVGAAHVNHMLRGSDADNDENFTRNLCQGLNIEYYCKRVDIDIISKKNNISHELAGREERYKFFEELSLEKKYNKIAIAHNLNDNAETVLMRLMRGTGLDGLIGIRCKRDEKIIRPIMCLTRDEIERYIYENSIETCLDKTNLERDYSRNKIRLDLIPYMKRNFNEDLIKSINRMTTILDIDNDYIQKQVEVAYGKYVKYNNNIVIDKLLFMEHQAIVSRVIRKSLSQIANTNMNFEQKHISDLNNLSLHGTGKKIDLPNGIVAENIYGDIIIKKKNKYKEEDKPCKLLSIDEVLDREIEFKDYSIKFEKILNKNNKQISNNDLIKYFDYDKIKEDVQVRTRKDGDKFKPLGMNGSKRLKDIYINLKIPRDKRDLIPLICFDSEIAWIVGYRVSETFKVTNLTKHILKISINRKE